MSDQPDLSAIYERQIRGRLFGRSEPHPAPQAILTGGQPGSGKSRSNAIAASLAFPQHVASVVGDDLRAYHPDYVRLVTEEPLAMPEGTADAVSAWVEMAIADAKDNHYPVLIEGTFRRPEVTTATARSFRRSGFDVQLVALAVPDWESRLGILDRYVNDYVNGRAARWTSLTAHDTAYAAVPETIAAAIDDGVLHRVTILARDGRILHDSREPNVTAAVAALDRGRHRLPVPGESSAYASRLAANLAHLQQADQLDDRTLPLVDALRRDRDIVAALEARSIASRGVARTPDPPPAPNTTPTLRIVPRSPDVGQER